jgi:hypothetical protein
MPLKLDHRSKLKVLVAIGALSGSVFGFDIFILNADWFAIPASALIGALAVPLSGLIKAKFGARLARIALPAEVAVTAFLTLMAYLAHAHFRTVNLALTFWLFTIPTFIATSMFSWRCMIMTALVSTLEVLYFVVPPVGSFRIEGIDGLAMFSSFICVLGIAWLSFCADQIDLA